MRTQPKLLTVLIAFAVLLVAGGAGAVAELRFSFGGESRIWVEGTSSMHDWKVEAKAPAGVFTLADGVTTPSQGLKSLTVTVPAARLLSGKGLMDKKTQEALKARTHPNIRFTLGGAKVLEGAGTASFKLQAAGKLSIAGVEKPVQLVVTGKDAGGGKFRFTGSYTLNMTDFGVEPPTAMMGAMKTGNKVVVHFDVTAALDRPV